MQQIQDIFVLSCVFHYKKNNYNLNIEIHVVDGDGLNTNTLQQTI